MGGTTQITAVGTVGVPVTDQDRALEFYVGQLGFEKRGTCPLAPGAGSRWRRLGRRRPSRSSPRVSRPASASLTEDAGSDHAELRARGVDADPEVLRMAEAPPMFALRDPDGNSLILVEGS